MATYRAIPISSRGLPPRVEGWEHARVTGGVVAPELGPIREHRAGVNDPRLPLFLFPVVVLLALLAELSLLNADVSADGILTDAASGLAFTLAGLVAWRRRSESRIGPMMVGIGVGWFGGDLLFAPVPLIGPISFLPQAAARVLFAWLLLAFPSGRLESPLHRWAVALVATMAAVLGVLQAVTVDPADICACPTSPLAFASRSPLADRLDGIGAVVGLGMTFLLVPLVIRRLLVASPPARRSLIPVLVGGAFSLLTVIPELIHQLSGTQLAPFGWLPLVWIALPLGFLWVLLDARMARAAVADLIVDLDASRYGRSRGAVTASPPLPAVGRWPRWLAGHPTPAIRWGWGLALLAFAIVALVVPSSLNALSPVTRLAALGVGGALAASGMVAWERRPQNPIGPLLVLSGMLWLVGRLQGAQWPTLALVANVANSLSQGLVLAVLVAFPAGRIQRRLGWVIVVAGSVVVVAANLVQLTSVRTRTTPGLEGPNALYISMDEGLRALLQTASQVAVVVGLGTVVGWLLVRWWHATGPARRTYLPIFVAGMGTAAAVFLSESLDQERGARPHGVPARRGAPGDFLRPHSGGDPGRRDARQDGARGDRRSRRGAG